MKFGIIFYAVLAILALFIGVYFFKLLFPISIIFLIGALVNIIFIYKEYNICKSNKIIYNENTIPREIIIKYSHSTSLIAICTYCIFIILVIFILYVTIINFNFTFMFILTVILISGLLIFLIAKIIIEIKNMSKVMVLINEKGIQIKDNIRYLWNEIQLEKIIVKRIVSSDTRHGYAPEVNYLYFFHNNEKIEINIEDFDITDYQFAEALKIFRARYNNSILL